jgi:hypothetical protein
MEDACPSKHLPHYSSPSVEVLYRHDHAPLRATHPYAVLLSRLCSSMRRSCSILCFAASVEGTSLILTCGMFSMTQVSISAFVSNDWMICCDLRICVPR